MTLRKSDKMIAIIGVIILIIAGIGIVLYASTEDDEGLPNGGEGDYETFIVSYDTITSSVTEATGQFSIKPKLIGERTGTIPIVINQQNLKSVELKVKYSDNMMGIFWRIGKLPFGQDTFRLSLVDENGEQVGDGISIKGSGSGVITAEIGSIITLDMIEAKDISEAQTQLEERYMDYNLEYTINVGLKAGLWGRLREILKADTYNLEFNYTYYDYDVEPAEPPNGDGDGNPPTGYEPPKYTATNYALTKH